MELGNEARAAASNARQLLASAAAPAACTCGRGRDTAPVASQRMWLPPPSLPGSLPVPSAAVCAWPQHFLPHPVLGTWGPCPAQPPPQMMGHRAGQAVQPHAAAALSSGSYGLDAMEGVRKDVKQLRGDSAHEQGRNPAPTRDVAQQWRAARGAGGPRQKPGMALVPLQIDGSGRAPAAAARDARDGALVNRPKVQAANRGGQTGARLRSQRESLRGPQQQKAQQRRVRNWNDVDP